MPNENQKDFRKKIESDMKRLSTYDLGVILYFISNEIRRRSK